MVGLTCTALLEIQKMAFEKERRELQEAAEFEARVAALLAEIMSRALADPWFIENAKHINADATLKWARLSVEEEMDAEV